MRKTLEDTIRDAMEKALREATESIMQTVTVALERAMRDAARTMSTEVRKWVVAEAAHRTREMFLGSRKRVNGPKRAKRADAGQRGRT